MLQVEEGMMDECLFSELTQDIVSRGLGVVYEKCGSEQKKELVSSLVDTLTTGKRFDLLQYVDSQVEYLSKQFCSTNTPVPIHIPTSFS